MATSSKITETLARFAAEIETVVRDELTANVLGALSREALIFGAAVANSRAAREPTRKGAKRPPEEIEQLTGKLLAYITKHPGERIEQIGVGMCVPTKELLLPAKKLIAAGKIRTKGQKRATSYSAK